MKKSIALLILFLLLSGCQAWFQAEVENRPPVLPNNPNSNNSQNTDNQVNFELSQTAKLKIGQIGVIASENLTIKALSVSEDSRCPLDVVCVWQGRVVVKFILTQNDQTLGEFDLISLAGNDEMAVKSFGAYQVRLVSVEPDSLSSVQLAPSDYILNIEIIKQ